MPALADTKKNNKRRATKIVALTAALVVAGGAAFAWWTAGGAGTGSASTGDVDALTVVQTSTITGLAPGLPAQTLSGTFENPNDGPVYVSSVTVTIDSVEKAVGAPAGTCTTGDYVITGSPLTIGAEVLADDSSTWSGPQIAFVNSGSNQDGCKGATVHLAYTVS